MEVLRHSLENGLHADDAAVVAVDGAQGAAAWPQDGWWGTGGDGGGGGGVIIADRDDASLQ